MPVTRSWIGGGDNRANSPSHWSPSGAPQPGDTLLVSSSTPVNIQGNDLAGDPIFVSTVDAINLSHHAVVTITTSTPPATVNISGQDTISIFSPGAGSHPNQAIFNIGPNSELTLTAEISRQNLTINGGNTAKVIDNSTNVIDGSTVKITPETMGRGTFVLGSAPGVGGANVPGTLEFVGPVGKNISVLVGDFNSSFTTSGILTIDHPNTFKGSTVLQANSKIDLVGLANADSYTYQGDMLTLFQGNQIIEKLKATNYTGSPNDSLVVARSGSDIVFGTQNHIGPNPTNLPQHTM